MINKKNNPLKASNTETPSQQTIEMVIDHYQSGRFKVAEEIAKSLSLKFPRHPFGWKALGAILQQTNKIEESLVPMQKAVELLPHDAEAHCNLGVTLHDLSKLDEAKEIFMKALQLNPNFAEAYNNLGNTLLKMGQFEDAKENYKTAIALKPEYAEAYNNLGNVLKELGQLGVAKASYTKAISLKPDFAEAHHELSITLREQGETGKAFSASIKALSLKQNFTEAYVNLSQILKSVSFKSLDPRLYPIFTNLLTIENHVRPEGLARAFSTLLKQDLQVKDLIDKVKVFESPEDLNNSIASLRQLKLLHHLMRICPLPDLELEELFVNIRRCLLFNLGKIKASDDVIYFLSTLCLHCFTNEYVYFESEEETELIDELEKIITESFVQSKQPELLNILCLASFRPLHKYTWYQDIEVLDQLDEIKKRLVEEPSVERLIAKEISLLGAVSDRVSKTVRTQYEENPYPRWIKPTLFKGKSIAEFCDDTGLQLYSENIKDTTAPKILIAGCGTGQHSIATASSFSNSEVTAVDLSLSSLAYAKRKTDETKLANLLYMQADILNLADLGQEFDIIESVGVLHHMSEPMAGWSVLTKILKPGGLMRIGLYSELARQHIKEIRREIKSLGVDKSDTDMRQFRQSIITSEKKSHKKLIKSPDFFSLSMLRDLLFHEQEHRFTLPQIDTCLNELGLKFCGFGSKDTKTKFKAFYGEKGDINDLVAWHKFEENNPDTFIEMYQFWCQKL